MPLCYKGKVLEDCTKEELIQALLDLESLWTKARQRLEDEADALFDWVPMKKKAEGP